MTQIPLFLPRFNIPHCLSLIEECLVKGWTGIGYRTEEFEIAWRDYTSCGYAHFLNSSTSGLNLAVEILARIHGWPSNSEVITTPLTFISTNHAILHAGYQPVFADCDNSGCLTLNAVEECISPETKCIIFVGLGGSIGELPQISQMCKERKIGLIVDAAHMAGSTINGMHANCFGDITVYSFQAVKNLPTADSGMLCTNNQDIDCLARKLSWLGIDKDTFQRSRAGSYKWDYDVCELGYKYHGNSVIASIALSQLKSLDSDNEYRRQVAEWYKNSIDQSLVRILYHSNEETSSRHLFQIDASDRDRLMSFLSENGISTGVHYKDNSLYSMYKDYTSHARYARSLWSNLVTLPCHLGITQNDAERIGSTVNQYFSL